MIKMLVGCAGIVLGLFYLWVLAIAKINFEHGCWIFYIIAVYLFFVGSMLIMNLI